MGPTGSSRRLIDATDEQPDARRAALKSTATSIAADLGVKLTLLLPSVLGGFIALYFWEKPEQDAGLRLRCRQALVVAGGAGLGLFCGPLAVEAFNLTDKSGRLEMGFAILIAALGMAILANAVKALRSTDWGKAIESWITRR